MQGSYKKLKIIFKNMFLGETALFKNKNISIRPVFQWIYNDCEATACQLSVQM